MRYLFVHIPKTGGMSIRRGVPDRIIVAKKGNHVSPEYTARLLRVMTKNGEHHGNEHARWRDWREDLRQKHQAFAIVRNPWSRTVSRYTFAQHIGDRAGQQPFIAFLEERFKYGAEPLYWHRGVRGWYPQRDYVTDEWGELRCDVLRFGTDDVQHYLGLNKPLPIRNVSNTDNIDYRSYYGPEEHDIIAEWYASDIHYFGFTFDEHATRNVWTHGSSR